MSTMSPDPHGSDAMVGPHGADDHGADNGHDDHAHEGEALGPIDQLAWGAGILGILGGLAVAVLLAVAAGWIG